MNAVKNSGPGCVFTKCIQSKCNMVVPHSFFIKHLKNETNSTDNVNYFEKYKQWHCKQMVDSYKNMKWCPIVNCEFIIDRPVYTKDTTKHSTVECKCGHKFCFYCKN